MAAMLILPSRATSLLELLILAGILGTLAAVALPQWERARANSVLTQANADLNEIYQAVLAYEVDTGELPLQTWKCLGRAADFPEGEWGFLTLSTQVTTPVAYVASLKDDVFLSPAPSAPLSPKYTYATRTQLISLFSLGSTCPFPGGGTATPPTSTQITVFGSRLGDWAVMSAGPDGTIGGFNDWTRVYDPTNGSEAGNLVRSPLFPAPTASTGANWMRYE
ncbi:MAG: type II secretion system protein [Candidatus Sumerlaeia bacterium]|nr:type II secretion system protein [Candidatus Sumerlaeia bacterium]